MLTIRRNSSENTYYIMINNDAYDRMELENPRDELPLDETEMKNIVEKMPDISSDEFIHYKEICQCLRKVNAPSYIRLDLIQIIVLGSGEKFAHASCLLSTIECYGIESYQFLRICTISSIESRYQNDRNDFLTLFF
jgi:hypothetical protein